MKSTLYLGTRKAAAQTSYSLFEVPMVSPATAMWGPLVIRPLLDPSSPVTWVTRCLTPLLLWEATLLAAVVLLPEYPGW
jgi:hypothetical protein